MKMELGFESTHDYSVFVEFRDLQLFAGAGVHQMQLTATIDNNTAPQTSIVALRGDASIVPSRQSPRWLGNWAQTSPHYIRPSPDSGQPIQLPLSDSQVWAIEDICRENNLILRLTVNAVLVADGCTYPMINPIQYTMSVDRNVWLRNLDQIHLAAAFMVAAPMPGTGDEGHAAIAHSLRNAREAHNDNRPRDAATEVRKALERLRTLTPNLPSEKEVTQVSAARRDRQQRWSLLLNALIGIVNAAPHDDEVTAKIDFDRRDSQAIIATAIGLLGRDWD